MRDMATDQDALRTYLLDMLVEGPVDMLATPERRQQLQASYELKAEKEHPAVASVLREAAWLVRYGRGV